MPDVPPPAMLRSGPALVGRLVDQQPKSTGCLSQSFLDRHEVSEACREDQPPSLACVVPVWSLKTARRDKIKLTSNAKLVFIEALSSTRDSFTTSEKYLHSPIRHTQSISKIYEHSMKQR
eukprot:517941-Hanusia_phi.AAC.2